MHVAYDKWQEHFVSYFVFSGRMKVIQVQNNMRVNNWWHNISNQHHLLCQPAIPKRSARSAQKPLPTRKILRFLFLFFPTLQRDSDRRDRDGYVCATQVQCSNRLCLFWSISVFFQLSDKLLQTPECFPTETPDELHRVCLSSRHQHFKNRPGRPWREERCQSLHSFFCLAASLLHFTLTASSSQSPLGSTESVYACVFVCGQWTG